MAGRTTTEAKKLQCRIVPMLVLPAQSGLAGAMQIVAPECAADACMHWVEIEPGVKSSLVGGTNTDGTGFCGLDFARFK